MKRSDYCFLSQDENSVHLLQAVEKERLMMSFAANQHQPKSLMSPLKLSALAATLLTVIASPQSSAASTSVNPWMSTKDAIISAATAEASSPSRLQISNSDEYPFFQDLEFTKYWKEHAAHELPLSDFSTWQPDRLQLFQKNQIRITQTVDKALEQLDRKSSGFEEQKRKVEKAQEELQAKYDCVSEQNSWADNAAALLLFGGVINASLRHPGSAVALITMSCGTYYISTAIRKIEMSRLENAMKQNNFDVKVLSAQSENASQSFKDMSAELQQARALTLQNIALLNNGRLLEEPARFADVQKLSRDSRYRHMKEILEVDTQILESKLYGSLASVSDDDVFVMTMGTSSMPDSKSTYKLLRSNNLYYVALPTRNKMTYLEFISAKDVLSFFHNLAFTSRASKVGFINLDPVPTFAIQ